MPLSISFIRGLLTVGLALGLLACAGDDADGSSDGDPFGNADGDGASGDADGSNASGSGDGDGSGDSSGSDDSSGTGDDTGTVPRVTGGFIPMFPGAGDSAEAEPLTNGGLCDYVEGDPIPDVGNVTRCFFSADDDINPAATIEQVLECVEGVDTLRVRLTFDPAFVDNTYGANGIGWDDEKNGMREFKKLTGSDHAEILILDDEGNVAAHFKIDYISEDDTAPSGFASLGVDGGDGGMIEGDPSIIVKTSTSIDRNLNERGYGDYAVDSPETDEDYTPNPDTPDWDYRVVFEAWIDMDAFGDAEFGGAFIEFVHASPSKQKDATIDVLPGECPPDWNPPADTPNCPEDDPDGYFGICDGDTPTGETTPDPCLDDDPDTDCAEGEVPATGSPAYCERFPTDPECYVE